MAMGADDYLTKPFDDIELLDAVEMRLKKADALKKEFEQPVKGFDEFVDNVKGADPGSFPNERTLGTEYRYLGTQNLHSAGH